MDKIDKDKNGSVTHGELKAWIKFRGSKWLNDDASRLWKYVKKMTTEIGNLTKKEREVALKTLDMDEPITWEAYKHGSFRCKLLFYSNLFCALFLLKIRYNFALA